MIFDLIQAGGVIFWILTAIFALVIASEVQSDRIGPATITLFAYLAALVAFSTLGTTAGVWLLKHPIYILYGTGAYIVGAVIWTPIKWRAFFLPALFEKYNDLRAKYLASKKLTDLVGEDDAETAALRADFLMYAKNSMGDINQLRMVRRNKANITTWIAYWPFSLVGTFIGDFLTRIAYNIYRALASSLQRMSDGMASRYVELDS